MSHDDWWFDGDYGECYWAPGHVSKIIFAVWVSEQPEQEGCCPVQAKDIEHVWVINVSPECFMPYKPSGDEYEDIKARIEPMTRYKP